MLFYDKYDIWLGNLLNNKPSVNLTNSYGRKNKLRFRIAGNYNSKRISIYQHIILTAFDTKNKNSGFFRKRLDDKGDPELLTMGAYSYADPTGIIEQKASDTNIYIIQRSSASYFPNYFWTSDFKTFTPVTNVYPEYRYNWLTSELISYKTMDGILSQGILYKPQNFDPNKKYPIIFHYYEKKSDRLNVYLKPGYAINEINIPWFVSKGYLVFTPDIYYKIGHAGESAFNSVVSAAKYLSKFPWIDTLKMGLQGHSFGGYETNYIITHSNIFCAAISAAGISDMISSSGGLSHGGISRQPLYESGQNRMGVLVWRRSDLYFENSPIFNVDKVSTPLLIMHNKNDDAVPFAQGVELFTALRRLGKKVWMLQYDEERHTLHGKKQILDYTIRMTQFFDHYLKEAPAPKWMTRGIPVSMKGVDDGLDLDTEIKTPGKGLLIIEQPKNVVKKK